MKKALSFIVLFAIVFGLLAGCGADPEAHVPTGDGLTWDEDYTGPVNTHPQQEGDQALSLIYYPDRSLNPLECTDFTNRVLFSLLYQSLFSIDSKYNPEPMLCREYAVSEDMRTHYIYLEKATFSDGTALTASDVAATYAAARDSAYYSGRFFHINDVSASGSDCVIFTLDTPVANLALLLDIPIVKASQVAAPRPLGTGPYVLDDSGAHPLLRRRDNWWCKADMVITAPAISLLEATDPTQIRDNFEFFDLDLVCADPGSDRYADYRCDFELWDCESGFFLYLLCNMDSYIFSIPEVRSALTFAIDRETIAKSEYRGFGHPATLPASPNWPHYSQVLAAKYEYDGTGNTFKKAVEDAGVFGRPLIILVNSGDSKRVRIARTIGQVMTDAGFVVEMKECNQEDFNYNLQIRNFDLCLAQTKLSPNMDLSAFFYTYGALSYGRVNDPALFSLCNEALANHGNYYTLHQAVMNDGRVCPILFYSYAVYATRGLMTELSPARDNIFYYSLGKNMTEAKLELPKPTEPPETIPETTPETTE